MKKAPPHAPTRENFDWWGGCTKGVPLHQKKGSCRFLFPSGNNMDSRSVLLTKSRFFFNQPRNHSIESLRRLRQRAGVVDTAYPVRVFGRHRSRAMRSSISAPCSRPRASRRARSTEASTSTSTGTRLGKRRNASGRYPREPFMSTTCP